MNTRIRTLMAHSLHVFALAVVGYFVWLGLRRDGEDRLFESIKVTHLFARERLEEDCEKRLGFVQRIADAYFNDHTERFLGRAMFTNRICDSVMQLVNDERLLPLAIDHHLSLLKDSLRASLNDDPYFTARFDTLLLPSGAPDFVKRLSNARTAQQIMLRSDLQINILLAKAQALNYFLQQSSGYDLRFDVFLPFWQPDVICPAAQEAFTATCFLSTYSYYFLRPRNTKVFINAKEAPIKNGYAEFTTSFDKAGVQPLVIRIETRKRHNDTLQVFEKACTVNVK